jgi:hypothetical protein
MPTMTVKITLINPGLDVGPFDLYSDSDAYHDPFEYDISRQALIDGYTSTLVPIDAHIIKIQSTGTCTSWKYVSLTFTTTPFTTTNVGYTNEEDACSNFISQQTLYIWDNAVWTDEAHTVAFTNAEVTYWSDGTQWMKLTPSGDIMETGDCPIITSPSSSISSSVSPSVSTPPPTMRTVNWYFSDDGCANSLVYSISTTSQGTLIGYGGSITESQADPNSGSFEIEVGDTLIISFTTGTEGSAPCQAAYVGIYTNYVPGISGTLQAYDVNSGTSVTVSCSYLIPDEEGTISCTLGNIPLILPV